MHLRSRVYLAIASILALVALAGAANAQDADGTLNLRIVGPSGVAADVVIRRTSRSRQAATSSSARPSAF